MITHSEPWSNRSATSKIAHLVERTGLALTGMSCGLFVAAHIARANINLFGSTAAVFAIMIYGAIGFYLGIDLPRRAERLHELPRQFDRIAVTRSELQGGQRSIGRMLRSEIMTSSPFLWSEDNEQP